MLQSVSYIVARFRAASLCWTMRGKCGIWAPACCASRQAGDASIAPHSKMSRPNMTPSRQTTCPGMLGDAKLLCTPPACHASQWQAWFLPWRHGSGGGKARTEAVEQVQEGPGWSARRMVSPSEGAGQPVGEAAQLQRARQEEQLWLAARAPPRTSRVHAGCCAAVALVAAACGRGSPPRLRRRSAGR